MNAPAGADTLRLDAATASALIEHAWSDVPFEVCGLLGVHSDGRLDHYPITNAERSMTYFVMDASELLPAMRAIEDAELDLVIYHSHTHTEAYPSRTDIRYAAYPDAVYLIVSLQDRDAPELRAFRIRDGVVSEVRVEVAPATAGATSVTSPLRMWKARRSGASRSCRLTMR